MAIEWVTRYTERGERYRVREDTSMIPILPEFLNCCVYIYKTEKDARAGEVSGGGSGFWVSVPFKANPDRSQNYAVTAKHVLDGMDNPVLRVNRKDGTSKPFVTNRLRWKDNGKDDLAVYALDIDENDFAIMTADISDFVDERRQQMIYPGDEAFMVGRFISHEGKEKNSPSVRFGNISMLATETRVNAYGHDQQTFLVEQRSLPGYSGSPVFVFLNPSQPRPPMWMVAGNRIGKINRETTGPWLLGVDWLHIHNWEQVMDGCDEEAKKIPDRWVKSHTGMAGVIPAWKLAELLDCEELLVDRAKDDRRITEENKPKSYSSYDSASPDAMQITPEGAEIPVPTKDQFLNDLKKIIQKTGGI
jgi:hypothetical protein